MLNILTKLYISQYFVYKKKTINRDVQAIISKRKINFSDLQNLYMNLLTFLLIGEMFS